MFEFSLFLGVVLMDISISEFKEELTEEETNLLIDQLFNESLTCVPFETSDCKLQVIFTCYL